MKKYKLLFILLSVIIMTVPVNSNAQNHNTLSAQESADGWILLFDGETTEHWRGYNMEGMPDSGWIVEDGALVFDPQKTREGSQPADIITKEKYRDFEFKIDWWIEEGGNSGIFYHVLEQPTQSIYWSGPELQILDNENHPDADQGIEGNRKAGSLYDLIPASPQNTKPYGEWNSVKIVSKGPVIEHWQNGEKVVEFERWTPEWFEMIRNSKFINHPEFGAMQQGHLGLQDHGDLVKFRNIKIKPL